MNKIKSDIEIARSAKIKPIGDVLRKFNVPDDPFSFVVKPTQLCFETCPRSGVGDDEHNVSRRSQQVMRRNASSQH